jgi:hypothetical protein
VTSTPTPTTTLTLTLTLTLTSSLQPTELDDPDLQAPIAELHAAEADAAGPKAFEVGCEDCGTLTTVFRTRLSGAQPYARSERCSPCRDRRHAEALADVKATRATTPRPLGRGYGDEVVGAW